jgi:hypothetical protein
MEAEAMTDVELMERLAQVAKEEMPKPDLKAMVMQIIKDAPDHFVTLQELEDELDLRLGQLVADHLLKTGKIVRAIVNGKPGYRLMGGGP